MDITFNVKYLKELITPTLVLLENSLSGDIGSVLWTDTAKKQ